MKKILLLSAGTNACYHVAKTLKEKFPKKFKIIGADINDSHLIPTEAYIDRFYKVPYTNQPNYYETILEICRDEKIDYLLPSFDADQKLFYPENNDLKKLGVISLGTNLSTLSIYDNKIKMYEFLQSKKIPLPKRYTKNDVKDEDTYFIKPINGVASIGARKAKGKEIKESQNISDFIIQEVCSEPEITLECFFFDGVLRTVARERIAAKAGVCVKARVFNDLVLRNIALKFVQAVKTPYFFNLQFMKNASGDAVITDVNLRTAGGMSLSYAAGWDEVSALAKIMLKQKTDDIFTTLPENISEQYVVRAYTDIVTKSNRPIIAFDWDGTLLDSRFRHKIVMDYVLHKFNITLDTSDLVEFKRDGKNNIDFLLTKGIDKELAEKIQSAWIDCIEKEEFLVFDTLYPETTEILQTYALNNDLILISARNNKTGFEKQLQDKGVLHFFKKTFVVPSDKEADRHKSDILKQTKAVLMVGDTRVDFKAADMAKINFQFHENGFHKKEVAERK